MTMFTTVRLNSWFGSAGAGISCCWVRPSSDEVERLERPGLEGPEARAMLGEPLRTEPCFATEESAIRTTAWASGERDRDSRSLERRLRETDSKVIRTTAAASGEGGHEPEGDCEREADSRAIRTTALASGEAERAPDLGAEECPYIFAETPWYTILVTELAGLPTSGS
mmetsp:Transcript_88616/g.185195  ORF Transcript_88616/g.185195 Transcript_88616/m.185195 type:complete len:169 (+) Transcript_88616:305-811(+)